MSWNGEETEPVLAGLASAAEAFDVVGLESEPTASVKVSILLSNLLMELIAIWID